MARENFPFNLKEVEILEMYLEIKAIAEKCIKERPEHDHYTQILKKIVQTMECLETDEINHLKDRCKDLKTHFDELREILASTKPAVEVDLDLCRYSDKLLEMSEEEPVLKKEILKRLYKYSKGLLPVYDDCRLERTNNPHEGVNNKIKTENRRISGKTKNRLWLEFHGAHEAIGLNFIEQEAEFLEFLEVLKDFCENMSTHQFVQYFNDYMKLREEHRTILRLRKEELVKIKKRIESILIPPNFTCT